VPRVPLRHGEGNKDHLTSFGGLAALSLDALSSVAYGPEAIVLVLAAAGTSALRLTCRSPSHRGDQDDEPQNDNHDTLPSGQLSRCGQQEREHRAWYAFTPESSAPAPSRKQPIREGPSQQTITPHRAVPRGMIRAGKRRSAVADEARGDERKT
jgi:hypothetical protein